MKLRALTLACSLLALCACEGTAPQENIEAETPTALEAQACSEPRPQICTMIYEPVCANREDGSKTTEASDCSACSDEKVVSYVPGECK